MLKTLITGIFFTSLIFAIKSGIGIAYMYQKRKFSQIFSVFIAYFSLFLINFYLIKHFDFTKHFNLFEGFLKKGILVHIILATGMFIWGLNVLLSNKKDTKAYILLAMPCPICFLVILLSIAILYKFIGNYSVKYTLIFYSCFILFQMLTAMIVNFFKVNPENFLGMSLIMIGVYFIITYLVAPVFSDIDRIYRISAYSYSNGVKFYKKNIAFFIFFSLIVVCGYLKYKLKRINNEYRKN